MKFKLKNLENRTFYSLSKCLRLNYVSTQVCVPSNSMGPCYVNIDLITKWWLHLKMVATPQNIIHNWLVLARCCYILIGRCSVW